MGKIPHNTNQLLRFAGASLIGAAMLISGCTKEPATNGPTTNPTQAAEPTPVVDPTAAFRFDVGEKQAGFYKQAFPEALRFEGRKIAPEMVTALDKGNDTYVRAIGKDDKLIGYLRDFTGPVTPHEDCPCSPLNVTFAFTPELELRTLISATGLTKWGNEPMTDAEVARLVEIARNPNPALVGVADVKDLVDGISGPTKKEFKEFVVEKAALTSWRVATLTSETRRILQGAPLSLDQKRLESLLSQVKEPRAQAEAIAEYLEGAESPQLAIQAFQLMVQSYLSALKEGASPSAKVEALIPEPPLPGLAAVGEAILACFAFAQADLRIELVGQCLAKVEPKAQHPMLATPLQLAKGALLYRQGKKVEALPLLESSKQMMGPNPDPSIDTWIAEGLALKGEKDRACDLYKKLYIANPLFEGLATGLQTCGPQSAQIKADLDKERKSTFLTSRRAGGSPTAALNVQDDSGKDISVNLAEAGKPTILVFFATWCPHCQNEMPKLVKFVETMDKAKIQMIGVRTSVEREQMSYSDFKAQYKPNFPIYTDATMSLAFGKFARDEQTVASMPKIAVLDRKGVVQFILENNTFEDPIEQIQWAIEEVSQF
jgi:thiol-disulfide isomerase/thioredoxin